PKKCTFGTEEGMFLGYKVSTRGLKVCLDKVLAKSAEKSLPFFKTLKKCTKKSDFHWTAEAKDAFKQMKQLIAELPILVAPMEKEELIVYLAAAKETVYFIVERPEEDSPDTPMTEEDELPKPWILFTDGSSCTDGSGAGLILTNPEGRSPTASKRSLSNKFLEVKIKKADALTKIATTSFAHLSKQVMVEELKKKSISIMEVLAVVEEDGDTWMTPIFKCLTDGTLSTEIKKARAVKRRSWRFAIINETLYKKSFLGPWLRCVGPLQANYVLRQIHEGSCSMHAGKRSVVAKALRTGYYWPTMHKDARTLIRACQ
nr:reverse transcriptase domain-containing protein [Tanacetum cinerariifolium]